MANFLTLDFFVFLVRVVLFQIYSSSQDEAFIIGGWKMSVKDQAINILAL